jgi:hypothetical protein
MLISLINEKIKHLVRQIRNFPLKPKENSKKIGVPYLETPIKWNKAESYFGFFKGALPAPAGLFANSLSGTSQ